MGHSLIVGGVRIRSVRCGNVVSVAVVDGLTEEDDP